MPTLSPLSNIDFIFNSAAEPEMEEKIKVLVVDDASFMVRAITEILSSDPGIEVVGSARNGLEALDKIKTLQPDVITLDIDMPIMDGIRTIRHIMIEFPIPIVVLSSLFGDGAITFEALRLGVVDFLPKPSGAISKDIHRAKQQIVDRVKIAASVNMQNIRRVKLKKRDTRGELAERYGFQSLEYILLVGTTLGGPNTAIRLLSNLSPQLPMTAVLVQEIAPKILPAFVKKFDEHMPWKIEIARDDVVLEQGTCYVSAYEQPIALHLNQNREACLQKVDYPSGSLNALFTSAATIFENHTIGVLLTGVGDDGIDGFNSIKEKSGITIVQRSDTCVYPNLAQCAIEHGNVDFIVDENEIPKQIKSIVDSAVQ
ncbi:MAG: chemotaxis protein CheB [Candidatus Competibacter denitrificans]